MSPPPFPPPQFLAMKFFCIPASLFCRGGPIEQLDFSQLRLDQVPKEIFKARKHIEELLLNVNSIEELPADLFRCTKIRRLDVSENKIKVIPVDIGALPSLVELNLSKNEIVEMPEEIGLCHNLAFLDISTNIVTGFPKSFVNLTQLSSLNLSNNSITHLPPDIDGLVNLQFLDVAQCELRLLPPSIVRLERLRVLDLCDNYLTELPPKMDCLISLEVLDLHCNMVGRLPDELLRCRSLRTLDVSGNQLTELPLNIGDLQNLAELVLCENQIRHLPSSIGQLKKLEVLKASKNNLAVLTPSICSCALLTDLVLCENQLQEIPSSIGNLRRLRFLDLNVNNLHSFPPTIGGCQSLAILSLRHNHLSEMPMEIGKLNQLQVLDLADNSLQYLPYTLTVLYKAKTLSALWLSFNQPPLPKLTTTHEPVMNIKVLTCYLLPQKGAAQQSEAARIVANKSCVGGARVCFAGDSPPEEDDKMPIGKFERYDTPHPKPFAPKNRLSRNSGDFTGTVLSASDGQTPTAQADGGQQTQRPTAFQQNGTTGGGPPLPNSSADVVAASAAFAHHGTVMAEESRPLRSVLKRRPQSVISHISTPELLSLLNNNNNNGRRPVGGDGIGRKCSMKLVRKNINVRRGANGFEWTIVGGANSLPYKDKSGLFISQLVPGGAAHSAGFRVDDCLLSVNGNDLRGLTHEEAIQCIQTAGDRLDLLIEREQRQMDEASRFLAEAVPTAAPRPPERCCAMIVRNKCGLPGFTVSGAGRWPDNPFIVARVDVAESSLRSGDRILSVGGTNVKFGARLDQVKTLLAGFPGTRVEVVVERGGDWPPPALRVPPKLPPKRYGAVTGTTEAQPPLSSASAFGELTLTRSLPSLFVPTTQNGDSDAFSSFHQHHHPQQNNNNCNPLLSPSSSQKLLPYMPATVAASADASSTGQQQLQQHRSFTNLLMNDMMTTAVDSNNSNNGGGVGAVQQPRLADMLRASTPIEYPSSPTNATVASAQLVPNSSSPSTSFSAHIANNMVNNNNNNSCNGTQRDFAMGAAGGVTDVSPPLPPKMMPNTTTTTTAFLQNGGKSFIGADAALPLATSSPIPGGPMAPGSTASPPSAAVMPPTTTTTTTTKASHIPVALANNSSIATTETATTTTTAKVPPPVAPKPKAMSDKTVPSSSDQLHLQHHQSPPSPTASSFSCKLKLFEAQSRNSGHQSAAGDGPNGRSRPSGIPLKKPLVCAQDLEKLKEGAEQEAAMRRRMAANSNNGNGKPYPHHQQQNGQTAATDAIETNADEVEEEADEHRDTVHELTRLLSSSALGSQHHQQNGGIAGPSVVRTKKAELRAERVTSNHQQQEEEADADTDDAAASLSRTDSSLSQRAAEIEKRREWRQARLRSMDVESQRSDELMRMITAAAAADTATASSGTTNSNNTISRRIHDDDDGGSAVAGGPPHRRSIPTANSSSNNNNTPSPIPIAP